MFQNGWVTEVEKLKPLSHCNALKTVGYKELLAYLDGDCSIEDAEERIIISTRQFAKRQMTWFKKDERVVWFEKSESDSALMHCKQMAAQK